MKAKTPLLIVFVTIGIGVSLFAYADIQYKKAERAAYDEMTSNCIVLGISHLFNDYFAREGSYPAQDAWESYVIDNGYPSRLGCGTTSLKGIEGVIDVMGSPIVYEYVSPTEVHVFSEALRSRAGRSYHLIDGRWVSSTTASAQQREHD